MKLRALAALICCAAFWGVAAAADAKPPIATTISRDTATTIGPQLITIGHLSSPNPKCLAGRTVKLYYFYSEAHTLVDSARTSTNGFWAGVGEISGLTGLRFTVTRKTFGPRKHRRTCAAATAQITD